MRFETFLLSDYVNLDSDVYLGGGHDATAEIQSILDKADDNNGVHLIVDGAALVRTLELSSNTIIECLSKSCGFFQIEQSNCAVLTNKIWNYGERKTKNITIIGGTYNQNCKNQEHDVLISKKLFETQEERMNADLNIQEKHWIFGFEFYGIENLIIRDLSVVDFRTFAVMIGGFRNVTIENVWFRIDNDMHGNQDGFHFWGPGEFLSVKNVGGNVSDDFMNIGPDEHDKKSDITDVIVDGVFLEHADQAIRLLSRGTGRLDRVTIRNISGTYKSFGFYINPWFNEPSFGNFGNIFIENIDLRQEKPSYDYRPPILFAIGGNLESITLKNIRHHSPSDSRTVFEFGNPYSTPYDDALGDVLPKLQNVFIEDFKVFENNEDAENCDYIQVYYPIDNLIINNAYIMRDGLNKGNTLLSFKKYGKITNLVMNNIFASGLKELIDEDEKIQRKMISSENVLI